MRKETKKVTEKDKSRRGFAMRTEAKKREEDRPKESPKKKDESQGSSASSGRGDQGNAPLTKDSRPGEPGASAPMINRGSTNPANLNEKPSETTRFFPGTVTGSGGDQMRSYDASNTNRKDNK